MSRLTLKHCAGRKASFVFLLGAAMAVASPAQTFTTLVIFDSTNGGWPEASLIQATDGYFYGTTSGGGVQNYGTIFRVTLQGTLTTIHSFCAHSHTCPGGSTPIAALVQARDGSLYGTARYDGAPGCNGYGCGTVFKISPGGAFTTLHRFRDSDGNGTLPSGALIQATDGNFYGTTQGGDGGDEGSGTVFKITPAGELTTLHKFNNTNNNGGAFPTGTLIQALDGDFYGTTVTGGELTCNAPFGCGTVFKITPDGTLTTLHAFLANDGEFPYGALIQDSNGNFYGTTIVGGDLNCEAPSGCGTVFKMTPGGTFTILHRFAGYPIDGYLTYAGLTQATDGSLYGISSAGGGVGPWGRGTMFKISLEPTLTPLQTFEIVGGVGPDGGLIQATDGNFYGTNEWGGASCGCGTLFTLSTGLGAFVSLERYAGKVGETGGILGQGFTGTTWVSLNGIPANFTIVSDTYIRATVPAGATTGFVEVNTPSGTLTSNQPFRVMP